MVSWPKGSGIAIARPTRVLVFGKKSELKLVSHTAVAVSEHLKTPTYLTVCPTIPGPPSPHYVTIRSAPFIFLPGIMDPPTRSNSRRRILPLELRNQNAIWRSSGLDHASPRFKKHRRANCSTILTKQIWPLRYTPEITHQGQPEPRTHKSRLISKKARLTSRTTTAQCLPKNCLCRPTINIPR